MAKNFIANIESQSLQKDNSLLKMKVSDLERKLKELQINQNTEVLSLKIGEIKIGKNIRNDEFNYQYEGIPELAADIEKHGQLQPVLISQDNYLLAGYRRYNAIRFLTEQKESAQDILVSIYPKNFENIGSDELINIQLSENNQRRDIDNFQLSRLYNNLLADGYNQQKLSERFKRSKGLISFIVKINDIDLELVKLLKQFQIFGWSEKKFNRLNFSEVDDEKQLKLYENLKGIIGIKPLYAIAKHESTNEQKKAFLKAFKSRLSDEELESDFFREILEENITQSEQKFTQTIKYIKGLTSNIDEIKSLFSENEKKEIEFGLKFLSKLEQIIEKNAKKI